MVPQSHTHSSAEYHTPTAFKLALLRVQLLTPFPKSILRSLCVEIELSLIEVHGTRSQTKNSDTFNTHFTGGTLKIHHPTAT